MMKIIKPTLLIDEAKCRRNIARMAERAKRNNCIFRPHFKTHQSLEIGEWFREVGVDKIAVSSLGMANYFADGGWKDITVAIPVNLLEIEMINDLASRIQLNLVLESEASIQFLERQLHSPVNIFIKIDMGYQRTGIAVENRAKLKRLTQLLEKSNLLRFRGFLGHAGNSYEARSHSEIGHIHKICMQKLAELRKAFSTSFPNLLISIGDTPTCSRAEDFTEVDELRAGNFVFYDLMQTQIGACSPEDIAVCMACPVIALHEDRQEAILYGGGVHFSKDRLVDESGQTIWGKIVSAEEKGWGSILEGVYLKKLSQEHGTIYGPADFINRLQIGDIIKVLPVHSCMTADCMKEYLTTEGRKIEMWDGK